MATERESIAWEDLVAVGRVARAQGRFGEVVLDPLTDFPERFQKLDWVFLEAGASGLPEERALLSARVHKGRPVLKLAGISTMNDAEALAGREVRIRQDQVIPLPEGSIYHFEVVGLRVVDEHRGELGVVDSVMPTGGNDVLVVRSAAGREVLVPLCREICRRIDPEDEIIEIAAPDGLLD